MRRPSDRDAQVAGYVRTKANVSALVLYIAGAVSVASKGAKDVQEGYKKKKAKKNGAGDETEPSTDAGTDTDADADTDTASPRHAR